MARKPMVTRTIQNTTVTVMCLNVGTGEPETQTVTLSGTYKDNKTMLKAVKDVIETAELKAVHIVDSTVKEDLYGMTEQKFIENAEILPPRPVKNNKE